ncbi:MAG TPA: hypothetical protein PLI16_01755 [Bacteroidales bacterium]|nr:hypothetical protein [Bacteroidales bacterium]HOH83314.1 hypothetical protein [Bacteroidales bacterium]HPB26090.1 hypothetical protein [Bacteroidales bacterium]HQN16859.1 hypothetical protein [Bacteroidales bacterium]HQP16451.1 hypothetical protein [Bacteroidales bacterium]
MKTIKVFCAIFSIAALISCHPSQEEIDKQEKEKDSLMEIERDKALNNADKLLEQMDSMDATGDTITPEKK